MADLKISALPELTGALLQASDPFPVADLSAVTTKKITAAELAAGLAGLFPAGSINSSAVTVALPANSITSVELAPNAVTDVELADNSTTVVQTGKPATGHYVGQLAVDTTDQKAYVWEGSTWTPFRAGGSVNVIGVDNTGGPLAATATTVGDSVTLSVQPKLTTQPAMFLAGPTNAGGAVTERSIVGDDLPIASGASRGAVKVGGGLEMTGDAIGLKNTITPSNGVFGVVDVGANGQVIAYRSIGTSDLPFANASTPGTVRPGPDLTVDGTGTLSHISLMGAPGTYTKLTVNARGHVTNGEALKASDIPDLDASKITSGQLASAQLGARSITEPKLADYAIAYIQDTIPAAAGGSHHIGMLWLNPLAQQIRMWDGNVWVPIGVGALSEQNLRFCGLFDASTGKIAVVTKLGLDAGFKVGDTIPVTTEQLTGAYFVANNPGNGTAQTTGVTYDNGDWIVSISVAQGWERVDTLNSGGGGGSSTLDGLVDVTAPSPATGQALIFNGVNWGSAPLPVATAAAKGIVELATQAEVTTGTDTVRAVTPATLKSFVDAAIATGTAAATAPTGPVSGQMWVDTSKAPPVTNVWDGTKWVQVGATPADASETVKGVIELATTAEVDAGTDIVRAVTPKTLADNYLAKNIADLAPLP